MIHCYSCGGSFSANTGVDLDKCIFCDSVDFVKETTNGGSDNG